MTRQRVLFLALAVVLVESGCTAADRDGAAVRTPPAVRPPTATPASTASPAPTATPPSSSGRPASPGSSYRVTYGWAVPSRPVRVAHAVRVPVAPPPAPPLPLLTEVRAGDHPDEGYSRVTFAFRGARPSYKAYVRRVTFGLGLQVAAGSDQVLPVRVGELVRADGSHVVAVEVRRA